ncbi:lysosome membrane protein 2-like isoform X1 [Oratosquilla oratoria]|uniref:lysosome membrane protein 2-like isoform X1 n=1 Tax=Oratosquilla oratoria TaxID=337810 RepID=UPI003F765FD5
MAVDKCIEVKGDKEAVEEEHLKENDSGSSSEEEEDEEGDGVVDVEGREGSISICGSSEADVSLLLGEKRRRCGEESIEFGQKRRPGSSRTLRRCRRCWICGVLLCATGLIFLVVAFDRLVEKTAEREMVLKEGSQKYETWRRSEVPVTYSVYIFNLTNPEAFMAGDRPRVRELGPYVYTMTEVKEDVSFHPENGTVTFAGRPMYFFQPALSRGSEDDLITTLNIPFVNAADLVKDQKLLKTVISIAKKLHGFQTLRRVTIRELLWGHRSRVMDWARTLQDLPYPHHLFGLLVGLNDTLQVPYNMYTGETDPLLTNTIYSWGGASRLPFWEGPICNTIQGTDANGFHPGVRKTDRLYVFNGQLCRSLPLVYNRTIDSSGLTAYRFTPPADVFSYGAEHPENACYCPKGSCPPRGVLDMKPCYFGASVAFSFPHFYQGDPRLCHIVRGLKPDPKRHATEFDIYPDLGVPLRVKLRMQMNVVLDGNQALERARHFDVIFPVFWFEVGIESLPGEVVGLLKLAQNLPPVVKTTSVTVCLVLIVLFLVLLLAQTVMSWCSRNNTKSKGKPSHGNEWDYSSIHRSRPGGLESGSSSAGSTLPPPPPPHLPLDENGVPFIDDHTLLPPYRRKQNFPDATDAAEDPHDPAPPYTPVHLEVAPPYTAMADQPARTPSTVSVEIHTTASEEEIPTEGSTPRDGTGENTSIEEEAPETPRKEPLPMDENEDDAVAPTPGSVPNGDVPIIVPPVEDPVEDKKDENRDHTPSAPAPTPTPSVYSAEDPPSRPPQSPQSPRSPPLATSSPHNSTGPESPASAMPPPPQPQPPRQHRPPPLESEL